MYSYDDFGNISTIKSFTEHVMSTTSYVYDGNNRLVTSAVDSFVTGYSYDRQGNLISKQNDVGRTDYLYNGYNRMTGIVGENLTASYTYGYTGLRTSKTVNGVRTDFVNDGQNVVAQYTDGRESYFYRGIQLIGYVNSNNDVNYYQFNAHGDVTALVDCFGKTHRTEPMLYI